MDIRRFIPLFLLLVTGLTACTQRDRSQEIERYSDDSYGTSLRVFALILEAVTGDASRVEVLISDTQSPHAFHPRPSDMDRIGRSRILFLGDPHLDGWAERMGSGSVVYFSSLTSSAPQMPAGLADNPHFWTDPVVVAAIIPSLTTLLCDQSPDRCPAFRDNASAFQDSLSTVTSELHKWLGPLNGTCVFTSQPFYDYFLARFNIDSAGTLETVPGNETSASHFSRLLELAQERRCVGILTQRRLPDTAARLFSDETGLPLVYIDPIGSDADSSYSSLLRRNARAIVSLIPGSP